MRRFLWWPLILFFFTGHVSALSISFTNAPGSIDQDQEFSADVSLSCSGCSNSYMRGVFFPSGTDYFGFTKNNSGEWINLSSSGATQYYYVGESDIQEGSWSGKLSFKPDAADSAFHGPGSYFFKVGRYTSGGSVTWADAVSINITGPTPTPTLSPTLRPVTPTKTPTPSHTPSPTSTPSISPKPTSPTIFISTDSPEETVVLQSTPHNEIPTQVISTGTILSASDSPSLAQHSAPPLPAIGLISTGVVSVVGAIYLYFRHHS